MSDCHRGSGMGGDEFAHNSLIYKCALQYYLQEGFTYIELGDAEELWENEDFEQIYITHTSVYDLLSRFHHPDPEKTRYLKVWGNHDEIWKFDTTPLIGLFPGILVYETLRLFAPGPEASAGLRDGKTILLLHGHQADPTCSGFGARISKFLVRKVWSGLQRVGIGDPTRAAENPGRCDAIDETLYSWATGKSKPPNSTNQIDPTSPTNSINPTNSMNTIIAGHTHRPVYENLSLTERRCLESGIGTPGICRKDGPAPVYYNSGSCVHPRCITGIEITGSRPLFTLVKWGYATLGDSAAPPPYTLSIGRTVLEP